MKIEIKDNRKELILSTDEKNFENDIEKSKEKILDIAWTCWVEYHVKGQENLRLSSNPDSPRAVNFKGRTIKAQWNIQPEYKMTMFHLNKLLQFIKEDLK